MATRKHLPLAREELLRLETGTIVKNWSETRARIGLAYPNSYRVGMSNLGFQKVYRLFNDIDDVVCERFFLPDDPDIKELSSLESDRPMSDFDMIAFSITFEADYPNVLRMLEISRIPVRHEARQNKKFPVICAGGLAVTLNPEPMADFFDLEFIGEGEKIVGEIGARLLGNPEEPDFSGIGGVYFPHNIKPVYAENKTILRYKNMKAGGAPEKTGRQYFEKYKQPDITLIETSESVFGDMSLVEIGKGCGRHCRFCAAGYAYRPTRIADTEAVLDAVTKGLKRKGKIGLVGSAICDHPDIKKIMSHIVSLGGKFSVSSLRVDKLDDELLNLLKEGECQTLTIAPETGSDRLRKVINKNLTNNKILEITEKIAAFNYFSMKCYFLVGFPFETDDDVRAIPELAGKIRGILTSHAKERGTIGNLIAGVDVFIPKPFTPFERFSFVGTKAARKKISFVTKALDKIPNITVRPGSARMAYIETIFSVGDRRIGPFIEKCARMNGDYWQAMKEWPEECSVLPDFFVTRKKETDEILPWSMLEHHIYDGYTNKEGRKAEKGQITPDCPVPSTTCRRCGRFVGDCIT